MDLQGDDASVLDARLALDPDGGALAVKEKENLRAAGDDFVAVPVADLFKASDVVCVCLREHLAPARLVVERAGVASADVRLEAGHFVGRVGDALAAELHAAIHEALRADELVFEAQVEVFVALERGEELIARIPLQRTANDDTVADAPDRVGVAFPAGERFAVEERDRGGGDGEERGEREGEREPQFHRQKHKRRFM